VQGSHNKLVLRYVFGYVKPLFLLDGSKHFKRTSGIIHSKTQIAQPRKLQFSKYNKSGTIPQSGVKHILMFTLNKNVCILKAYR
jgi:hypothetical protein